MQLVGYQIKCFNELYHGLVNDNRQLIFFTGPKGCGKSVIIEELTDSLKENWQVYLLSGTGVESPPYYTWYSASQKISTRRKTKIADVSLGVNFEPVGLPIGVEISVGFSSGELIFNSNEHAIIKSLLREAGGNDNILFIADDYGSWDLASKTLLTKIIAASSSILGVDKCIHTVLVDLSKDNVTASMGRDCMDVIINDISLVDIKQIVAQQSYIKALQIHDLERIVPFTGYDLRLINIAVYYQQGCPKSSNIIFMQDVNSIQDLLEKRISYMSKEQQEICKILENVSIINSLFSEKEAAYLLDQEPIHTEKMLDAAVELKFIRKRHVYDFPDREIQRYFEAKLNIEKKYLHYRFSQYLEIHFPEDYFSRANHRYLSEEAYSEQNVLEAAYLMVIEIVRRKELTNNSPEFIIEERLNEIISSLPVTIYRIVKDNIRNFMEGNYLIHKCDYEEAILSLNNLQLMYATRAFSIESIRLLLLCHVQLADDLHEIKRLADDLYDKIFDSELYEDELWCRSALLLLEVYGDRHVQIGRFNLLLKGFDSRIRKHMYQSAFRTLHARYARKAALFYAPMISVKLTEESCDYYRTFNSVTNLYFSLCNNAANRIACGEYELAEQRLQECRNIVTENISIHFPSLYKVENNIIINTFLQSEGPLFDYMSRKKETIIPAAVEAARQLEQLMGQQGNEVSHVIEFNLLSMLLLVWDKDKVYSMLQQLKAEYKYFDAFYKYYYHNAYCLYSLLTGDFMESSKHLDILENLEVVLLATSSKILNRRIQIIHQLVEDQYNGDSFSLNYEFIKIGIHIQDSSASFWGRGFLLSDLQFLSF